MRLTPEQEAEVMAARQQMAGQAQMEPPEEPGILDKAGDMAKGTLAFGGKILTSAATMVLVGTVANEMREGLGELNKTMSDVDPADNKTPPASPAVESPAAEVGPSL